jgi:hypothetical protein
LLLLQLGVARAKARDAKRIADVNQVRSALELYFDDNASYLATNVMSALKPVYLINVPHEPLSTSCGDTYNGVPVGAVNCYGYAFDPPTAPTRMQVWAELEQKNTNALNNDTDIDSSSWGCTACAKKNGINEACNPTTPGDCIYDAGQP